MRIQWVMTATTPTPSAEQKETDRSPAIDEAMIRRVVHGFYDRARVDPMLGPVFDERVDDWPTHLRKMVDFWSAATLHTRRYAGKPAAAHAVIDGISTAHFQRWLELFAATVRDLCPPAEAALFINFANRMGVGLTATLRLPRPTPVGE